MNVSGCRVTMNITVIPSLVIINRPPNKLYKDSANSSKMQEALASPLLDPPPASSSRRAYVVPTHPAVAAQLVAVVHALLLRQRQLLPPLVKVAEPRVNLAFIDAT